MRPAREVTLRTSDGREVRLGHEQAFREAASEITHWTGGSSALGRWSYLWDLLTSPPEDSSLSGGRLDRIAEEAADFQSLGGKDLSDRANLLLQRLATAGGQADP